MNRLMWVTAVVVCAVGCSRCTDPVECADCYPEPTPYELDIPAFFPPMDIPADNPMTVEGVELGRYLFWDPNLSADGTVSCGSCHLPSASFSDPAPVSTGVGGAQGVRNSMVLVNVGWSPSFFWDGRSVTLEDQVQIPIPHPDEMALPWHEALARLEADPDYPGRFGAAFGDPEITQERTAKALAQFVRTLISKDSKYDRWRRGETSLTDSEFNGYEMFLREGGDPETTPGGQFGGDCFHCHNEAGTLFTDHLFRNNGLDASFEADAGLAGVTGMPLDSGRFKTPTLRNVALSAPYMHDGRFATLEEVIEHYNSGGVPSSTIDPFMKYTTGGLALSPVQKADLIAFLHTLTDTVFIHNPAFRDPR